MSELPRRKPNRLSGYDYSLNGAYFITVCIKNRLEILGHVVGARNARLPVEARNARPHVELTEIGLIVDTAIANIGKIYPAVSVDCYVIMPNHIHLLIVIDNGGYDDGRAMRAPTVSTVINQIKGFVTKQIGYSIWQKLFHDHIIRNDPEYLRIAEYMQNNPALWAKDCFNPAHVGDDVHIVPKNESAHREVLS